MCVSVCVYGFVCACECKYVNVYNSVGDWFALAYKKHVKLIARYTKFRNPCCCHHFRHSLAWGQRPVTSMVRPMQRPSLLVRYCAVSFCPLTFLTLWPAVRSQKHEWVVVERLDKFFKYFCMLLMLCLVCLFVCLFVWLVNMVGVVVIPLV